MGNISWTPALSVGHRAIDVQHQELFARANRLIAAMREGRSADELRPLLRYLEAYAEEHFRAEELVLRRAGYPGLHAHLEQHAAIAAQLRGIREEHDANGSSGLLAMQLNHFLCDWLLVHVSREDRAFGQWSAERGRSAA